MWCLRETDTLCKNETNNEKFYENAVIGKLVAGRGHDYDHIVNKWINQKVLTYIIGFNFKTYYELKFGHYKLFELTFLLLEHIGLD